MTEANGELVTWTYDSVYRLTQEQRNGANAYDIGYTYDGVGNRVTKTSGGVPTTYTCDAGDKMLRLEDNTGITTLTYDLNGNQTVKVAPNMAVTTYSYNYENKMTGAIFPDSSLNTFVYDGEGKRLEKRDSAGTLRFVYDEQGIVWRIGKKPGDPTTPVSQHPQPYPNWATVTGGKSLTPWRVPEHAGVGEK